MKNNDDYNINSLQEENDIWGAEAQLYKGKWFGFSVIKKVRIPKKYRIANIDNELRTSRTISESKLLITAKKVGVNTPIVFEIDLEDTIIIMENIEGVLVKDWLKSCKKINEQIELVKRIGEKVGILHTNDIIHGDLTTSNIIVQNNDLYFIDFGLGKFSKAIEDKAVDILLMKKCFTSTHTHIDRELFLAFQEGYKTTMGKANSVLKRAAKVESRGRHLKEEQVINQYLVS